MDEQHTPLTLHERPEDRTRDFHPTRFEEYLGQGELKRKLSVYTQAAHMRGEALDHLLLFGPPGLGKTTLAHIMAHTMHVGIKVCNGPMLERAGDLVSLVSSLSECDILFIDEIHRMPRTVEETLYNAMEHFQVDVILGQGAGAKAVTLPVQRFTLVGATTQAGRISSPLRSRFGIIENMSFYAIDELAAIIAQSAHHLQLEVGEESRYRIARASRGTPRIAKKLLRRVRDFAQVENNNVVTAELVERALTFLGIDSRGLTAVDRAIVSTICSNFDGGPVGLDTLASLVGEDRQTLEDVYEPFLLRQGYLERTPRGRKVPQSVYRTLRQRVQGQASLFDNI